MNKEIDNKGVILVIDDNPESVLLVQAALQEKGYFVSGATTGEKALETICLFQPDLILLDILMPGLDGFETCRRLRENESTRDIPIIFLSGLTETFDKVRAFKTGAVDYLIKPIAPEELYVRVETHLAINRLKKMLELQNSKLRKEVRERIQAEEALQLANQELKSFSYTVSHDLRSPLRAIEKFCEFILEDYPDIIPDEGKKYFNGIIENTKHMNNLIEALLTFSQISRNSLQPSKINLSKIAKDKINLLSSQYPCAFSIITVHDMKDCEADPVMMGQVVENLLSNALKYSQKNLNPDIEFGESRQSGVTTYFIKDNGKGFDMSQSEKLFKVFSRLHAQQEFPGTGVGLALVARIIHRHGGKIWADSVPDLGTTFYFTIEKCNKELNPGSDTNGN